MCMASRGPLAVALARLAAQGVDVVATRSCPTMSAGYGT
jgi:hypothetical protein|eukprot:COSAG01_NODE_1522_length_10022_cov_81.163761_12_plen_39_part_00